MTKIDYSKKTSRLKDEHRGVEIGQWIGVRTPTTHETCVKFYLYHTGRYYALQVVNGYGAMKSFFEGSDAMRPAGWSRSSPDYRESEEAILNLLERKCRIRGIELEGDHG